MPLNGASFRLTDSGRVRLAELLGRLDAAHAPHLTANAESQLIFPDPLPSITTAHGFVAGFSSSRVEHPFGDTSGYAPADDPPTVRQNAWRYECFARADRFAFFAFSSDLKDVMQQTWRSGESWLGNNVDPPVSRHGPGGPRRATHADPAGSWSSHPKMSCHPDFA